MTDKSRIDNELNAVAAMLKALIPTGPILSESIRHYGNNIGVDSPLRFACRYWTAARALRDAGSASSSLRFRGRPEEPSPFGGVYPVLASVGLEPNSATASDVPLSFLRGARIMIAVEIHDWDYLAGHVVQRNPSIKALHRRRSSAVNASSEPDPDGEHAVKCDFRNFYPVCSDNPEAAALIREAFPEWTVGDDGFNVFVRADNRADAESKAADLRRWQHRAIEACIGQRAAAHATAESSPA